jgi:hypothetical protein
MDSRSAPRPIDPDFMATDGNIRAPILGKPAHASAPRIRAVGRRASNGWANLKPYGRHQ